MGDCYSLLRPLYGIYDSEPCGSKVRVQVGGCKVHGKRFSWGGLKHVSQVQDLVWGFSALKASGPLRGLDTYKWGLWLVSSEFGL